MKYRISFSGWVDIEASTLDEALDKWMADPPVEEFEYSRVEGVEEIDVDDN